jgi:hypothetical protein
MTVACREAVRPASAAMEGDMAAVSDGELQAAKKMRPRRDRSLNKQ